MIFPFNYKGLVNIQYIKFAFFKKIYYNITRAHEKKHKGGIIYEGNSVDLQWRGEI